MKILFVSTYHDPDLVGGAEVAQRHIARGLLARGHEIAVLCTSSDGSSGEETREGIRILRRPMPNLYRPAENLPRGLASRFAWHLRDRYNPKGRALAAEAIAHVRPDIVCTANVAGLSIAVWDAVHEAGLPAVHIVNDLYLLAPSHASYENPWTRPLARCFRLRHARASAALDAVVALSRSALDEHRRAAYFENVEDYVVHTALPIEDRGPPPPQDPEAPLRFGFLGRLVKAKGIELLLDAFLALPRLHAELLVAGSGEASYVDRLRRRSADRRVHFLGHVKPRDLFARCDVCVVPSVSYDTLPNVVIESCAHYVPTIANRIGGIPEVIRDGTNGFLFRLDSRAEMMRALEFACAHREELSNMRRSSRAAVADFLDAGRQITQYEDLLYAAVRRHAGRRGPEAADHRSSGGDSAQAAAPSV
jgi:glycosyltransferase involved in cell wall biosynthesis